ncbi:hypothetical protein [Dactylosporangium sp. NPDC006015]|uniref:hypothetical protein n=1 Tax=Dactylosporangium sp. NPDC006015 TaxID=3154576 RepID=UPI0033A2849A
MTNHHLLRTTVPTSAIAPKLPPWAGPSRLAPSALSAGPRLTATASHSPALTSGAARTASPSGAVRTASPSGAARTASPSGGTAAATLRRTSVAISARAGSLQSIKWPDALGD